MGLSNHYAQRTPCRYGILCDMHQGRGSNQYARRGRIRALKDSLPVVGLMAQTVHGDSHVRDELANNPATPPEVLRRLAADEDDHVRSIALSNPSCPVDVLQYAGTSPSSVARFCVAGNPSCPPELLEQLLQDPDTVVAVQASLNPSVPRAALAMWELTQ